MTHNLHVKLTPGAHPPTRAHATDAGLDLAALDDVWLVPGEVTMVDTGVHVALPAGTVGLLCLRSSLGKHGVSIPNGVGVIDADYRGPLKFVLTAIGGDIKISAGQRIGQLVIVPVLTPVPVIVDSLPETERGHGGFGSTGSRA